MDYETMLRELLEATESFRDCPLSEDAYDERLSLLYGKIAEVRRALGEPELVPPER